MEQLSIIWELIHPLGKQATDHQFAVALSVIAKLLTWNNDHQIEESSHPQRTGEEMASLTKEQATGIDGC